MKMLGKRSVASLLYIGTTIFWYTLLGFSIITFLTFIIAPFFIKPENLNLSHWPIYMNPSSITYSIEPLQSIFRNVRLEPVELHLTFANRPNDLPLLFQFAGLMTVLTIVLIIVNQLRRAIKTAARSNPFDAANVRRFRIMGLMFLVLPFFETIYILISNLYMKAHFRFEPSDGRILIWNLGLAGELIKDFNWGPIFVGIVVFILAEIFKMGLHYQEDSTAII